MEKETFFTLLCDAAHWEFELFLIFLFDVVLGLLIWPRLWKNKQHHQSDDHKIAELEKQVQQMREIMGLCKEVRDPFIGASVPKQGEQDHVIQG